MIQHKGLKGGLVYYDGQHNDSRMNVCIALTAAAKGAAVANHVEVVGIVKDAQTGKVTGMSGVGDAFSGGQDCMLITARGHVAHRG